MKSKLFVAGCSVSDYTRVQEPYGEILANLIGFDYVHEGAGAGSNYRIWRKITNHVLSGNLTENDILIIQYTESVRNEFWSAFPDTRIYDMFPNQPKISDESYDSGTIIRFKADSHIWQNFDKEIEFHKSYEENFVNTKFAEENFRVNNYNFQQMLKNHNIKTIFLTTTRSGPVTNSSEYMTAHFKPYEFFDYSNRNEVYNLGPKNVDDCHFSKLGHETIANELRDHLQHLNWI